MTPFVFSLPDDRPWVREEEGLSRGALLAQPSASGGVIVATRRRRREQRAGREESGDEGSASDDRSVERTPPTPLVLS